MKLTRLAILAAASLFSTAAFSSNSPASQGEYTLDLIFTGSSWVGGRFFFDDEKALEGAITLNTDDTLASTISFGARAGIMQYIEASNDLLPYWRAGITLWSYQGNIDDVMRAYAGLGVEYMITDDVSIRGSVNGNLGISPNSYLSTSSSALELSFFF